MLALMALLLLAAAVAVRLAGEVSPRLVLRPVLARVLRMSGAAPILDWPRMGEAAVQVEGVGSLGSSGGSRPVPIASVAKVMTAYLTLRQHPLAPGAQGFVLSITPAQVRELRQRSALGESTVPVRDGERLTERQALEALLLPSANNIAALLAVHDAGSQAAFLTRMNAQARSLGMGATTYTDPSGFQAGTVSTASDQLRLARAAMAIPAFAAIVGSVSAEIPVAGEVSNLNALVGHEGYTGIKTGSDAAAGGCLLFSRTLLLAGRKLTIIGVVLGQREGAWIEAALTSAQRLGESAAAAVRVGTVLSASSPVLSVRSTDGSATLGVTAHALREIGWGGLPVEVSVAAPRRASRVGERLSTVRALGAGGGQTAVIARGAVGEVSLSWRLAHLL